MRTLGIGSAAALAGCGRAGGPETPTETPTEGGMTPTETATETATPTESGPPWSAGPYNAGPREGTASQEQWDLMYGINFNSYPLTPGSISVFWHQKGTVNFYGYKPEQDLKPMWDQVKQAAGEEKRQLLGELFGIISRDQPVNFVNLSTDITGYRQTVRGPVGEYLGGWDSVTWYKSETGERQMSDSYVQALSGDGETLIPFLAADTTSGAFIGTNLDGAYVQNKDGEIFPLWLDITTDDHQVFVCSLRDNLMWSDPYGQMTAEDWVYYIQEIHQSEWAGSVQAGDWEGKTVTQTGDLEFQIELPQKDPAFPNRPVMWGASVLPKDLIQGYVQNEDLEGLKQDEELNDLSYTGNLGPYNFDHWTRDAEFVATRNDDYYMHDVEDVPAKWQNAPYYRRVVYRIIPEESTRLNALDTGEVDTANIPYRKITEFRNKEDVKVIEGNQPFTRMMPYNQNKNGWDQLRNRKVRWGLSTAISKRVILEQIQRGAGEIAHTHQPKWSKWYNAEQVKKFGVGDTYGTEKARQLIDEGTSSDYGFDGGQLLGPDGEQVELTLVWTARLSFYKDTAEYIKQELEKVGIAINLESVEWSTLLGKYVQNQWVGMG